VRINYPRSDREGWRRLIPSWKLVLGTIATLCGVGLVVGLAVFAWAWLTIDIPEENEVAAAQTTIIYWNDGEAEMARIGDTNRIYVPIEDIPQDMQDAVVAAEDRRFFEHSGFDVVGLTRAVLNNLTGGSRQGGSTITQQYAKNAYLSSEQTYVRKVKELVLSLKLEATLTKEEILERYLNTIYFGRGAYGVQTAAEAYFGVDAKDLTLEQSAVLAAIINAPGLHNPDTNMESLQKRYSYVLGAMLEEGFITQDEYDQAIDNFPEIKKKKENQRYGGTTGYLIKSVEKELLERGFTEAEVYGGGLRVTSTFDRKAQKAAVAAVKEQGPTTNMEGVRIGLAAIQPVTGEFIAMYGGADYLEDSLNNATQAVYQAGSTFKPFALAAATEQGIGLDSLWPGNNGYKVGDYTVKNYGQNSYGEWITLLKGTEQSVNTVYVPLTDVVGPQRVEDAAIRAGIPADTQGFQEPPDVTFSLGTDSPHTVDVANAYATFASRGERANRTTVLRTVTTAGGDLLYQRENDVTRTFDENTSDVVNYALQKVVTNGTGRPATAIGRPVAAKTGTTDFYKSSWFAGYVPQLAAAVSFGKSGPDGTEESLSGVGGLPQFYGSGFPARIFTAFMRAALADVPVEQFQEPAEFPSGGGLATVAPTPSATEPTAPPTTAPPTTAPPTTAPPTTAPPTNEPPQPPTDVPPTDAGPGQGQGQGQGQGIEPVPAPTT
jgi:membrane peptidoglycan carboxypeptidase